MPAIPNYNTSAQEKEVLQCLRPMPTSGEAERIRDEAVRLSRQRDNDLVQQGRELERTEGRLTYLEGHAKSINGQIKRMGDLQQELRDEQRQTNVTLSTVIEGMQQRAQDAKDRDDRQQKRDQRRLSKWQIFGIIITALLGFAMMVITMVEVILK
jgi:phenylpropionate dioxygenase-like ring-hydroxylating dioxygenase large terminal subunit